MGVLKGGGGLIILLGSTKGPGVSGLLDFRVFGFRGWGFGFKVAGVDFEGLGVEYGFGVQG